MNKEVSKYIEKQKSPQKEICQKVRKIFLNTLKKPEEKKQWGVISFGGGKFYLVALKESVNIGFAITGLDKDEIKLFEGNGKTMRHLKFYSPKDVNEKKITKLIKMVNRNAKCVERKK